MTRFIDSPLNEMDLSTWSLEEKVGQLFLVYFEGPLLSPALKEMIREYHIGGLIFYSVAGNIQTLSQVAQLTASAQAQSRIPLWMGIDQEGGPVVRLTEGVTVFPSARAVAAAGSLEDAEAMAQVVGIELKSLGFNLNFAPVVDVNSNPYNPIIGIRAFGSDPQQVADYGLAMLRGYRQAGILCTPKHFPGHGDTHIDSHLGLPRVDRPLVELQATELYPFQALIQAGAEAIMTAHVVMPALGSERPATLAPEILSGELRQRLGFTGVIFTDSMTMGAIAQTYGIPEAAELAFQAGADILLFGADRGFTPVVQKEAYAHLLRGFRSGRLSVQQLEQSVQRILNLKQRYRLGSPPDSKRAETAKPATSPSHQALAQRIALASITLLKGSLPPLAPDLLLITPVPLLGELLQHALPSAQVFRITLDPNPEDWPILLERVKRAEQVVVGSLDLFRHPAQSELLAKLVSALSPEKVIGLALGSPEDPSALPQIPVYLACYGTTPVSLQALVEVLLGRIPA
ncbi:beta-N-acetylhexosaminidase [Thermostichus vulcanus]|uniref:beta-N-acetylhexosaminidase n=1 Tax=Thermostichus vulcanus str. 'Rupite' TaxID=2813851 RepID=A0ABT0CAL2_THEVL|nr:beta-N-acetylhexosaminidase [Thermostichus vulcanus]MCJ2542395.1 beta-N-acetylhexosaminidase [Thermostichus vulcanus str. 'Rupite']